MKKNKLNKLVDIRMFDFSQIERIVGMRRFSIEDRQECIWKLFGVFETIRHTFALLNAWFKIQF